jgi:Clp amino terminal domain, pathogenicity island component
MGEETEHGQIPFTPRAKKVLELALREALRLRNEQAGTEHILLGLVRENEGVAVRIMSDFGADSEKIRSEVSRMLSAPADGRSEPSAAAAGAASRPAITFVSEVDSVSAWRPHGGGVVGWRRRPIALAALGAASMSRRAFHFRAPGDLDPLALQLLVAIALLQPASDEEVLAGDCSPSALHALVPCDGDELDAATTALRLAGLIAVQEPLAAPDPEAEEQTLILAEDGAALIEEWLTRIAPLFGAWPPDRRDVDDAR